MKGIVEYYEEYKDYYKVYKDLMYVTLGNDFVGYPTKNKNYKKGKKYKSLKSRANRRK